MEKTTGWQPISEAPKDGTPVQLTRHDPTFGWVRGWGYWEDVKGISGWVSFGFFEPPGNLGLGGPTHWQPIADPPTEI